MKIKFPLVTIIFDDGLSSVYSKAFPLLENYGYKANVALSASKINKKGFLKEEQIKELLSRGWALSDHTYSHLNLATATPSVVKEEIILNQKLIQNMFRYRCRDFVFPKSRWTTSSLKVVLNYYPIAYTGTKSIGGNRLFSEGKLMLRTEISLYEILLYGFKGTFFLKALKKYLQELAINKPEEWFIVFTHGVSRIPQLFDSPTPFFKSFLNTIETCDLTITTTEQALRFLGLDGEE